jgi:acyl-CoA thioesterase-1
MPPRETDAHFETGLREVFRKLQATHAKVIWATITPAPDGKNTLGPESWNPSVLARNALSKYAASDAGIAVDDLYELVIGRREQLQGFANLHFMPEGSKLMGEQVAAKILEALNQKTP